MKDVPNTDARERYTIIHSLTLERHDGGSGSVTIVKYETKPPVDNAWIDLKLS